MKKYEIISAESIEQLGIKVSEAMNKGAQLYQGLVIQYGPGGRCDGFLQAVISK